mgnify:CR=1 FL=1
MIEGFYDIAAREARKFNVSSSDRDDLVQEAVLVMLRATARIEAGREERSRLSYLRTTTRNSMKDSLRKLSRDRSDELTAEPIQLDTPFDHFVAKETSVRLFDVFATAEKKMSERELSLFRLRLLGETNRELDSLHSGTRGVYSVRARRKLSKVSGEKGCRDIADDHDFAVLFAR